MSVSVTGHSGGTVIPKGVVPMRLIDHAKRLDRNDERHMQYIASMEEHLEIIKKHMEMISNRFPSASQGDPGQKAGNHPNKLWGTIELQNQTVKIYKNGDVESQRGLDIDLDNIDGAQNRADAILSKFGGKFEKIAHQQELEFISQDMIKMHNSLTEQLLKLQEMN